MAAVICCVLIVPRAYAAKFHPARGFALSRRPKRRYSTAREFHSHLLRSYARLCIRGICMCAIWFVCVYTHTLKKRHCEIGTVSLRLILSSLFTLAHMHTSAIASLFAPFANCCILHAYEACLTLSLSLSVSLSLSFFRFLSFFLACSLLSSLLTYFFLFIVSPFLHLVSSV